MYPYNKREIIAFEFRKTSRKLDESVKKEHIEGKALVALFGICSPAFFSFE